MSETASAERHQARRSAGIVKSAKASILKELAWYAITVLSLGVYWLTGWLALIGFFSEHPFAAEFLSFDFEIISELIRHYGVDDIIDTWTKLYFVLVRTFGGGFGFLGCYAWRREWILVAIALESVCFFVKLSDALIHLYAWIVTDKLTYFVTASGDVDIVCFDFYIILVSLVFAASLKRPISSTNT